MKFFRLAAEAHYINDPWHLFELALQDPVLGSLEVHQALPLTDQLIAIDLPYRRRRGQLRLHPRRELRHLQAIEHFLAGKVIVGFIGEIAFDVGQAKIEMERR